MSQAIRTNADLIAQIRARKNELGLADEYFEEKVGMSAGNLHKYIGLNPTKVMSVHLLCNVASFLGCKLMFQIDPDYIPKAINEWKPRDEKKVHGNRRLSAKLVELAKPLVHKAMSASGGRARAANLAVSRQAAIAQKGGRVRMRKLTKAQRSELAGLAAKARWKARSVAAQTAAGATP